MKKIFLLSATILGLFFFMAACHKKDNNNSTAYTCSSCSSVPNALPANDASGKGIYKGVVIGSTGTIEFSLLNGSDTLAATLVLDGTSVTLISSVSWVDGQPYIAPFTGTMAGSAVTVTFSVGPDGTSPTVVSSDIPGHPGAIFNIVKETSDNLIECFEGTYTSTKPENGTFNIIISRHLQLWAGIAREAGTTDKTDISGSISGTTIKNADGTAIGTRSDDELHGTFTDANGATVTFSGHRTL